MSNKLSAPSSWRQTIYGYLALTRISNGPTVISNTLAGAALAGMILPGWTVAIVALAMLLFYVAGMYLNDVLDFSVDCRERPQRPLPAGLLSRTSATTTAVCLFFIGCTLLSAFGMGPFLCGLILVAFILCYDLWHKGNILSPLLMGLCRAMVYLTAFLTISPHRLLPVLIPAALLMLYVISLTYLARSRSASLPVNIALRVILFLPAAYVLLLAPLASLSLVFLFTVWLIYSLFFSSHSKKRSLDRMIERLIAGIALFDALILALAGSIVGVALALASFLGTLLLQRYVRGS